MIETDEGGVVPLRDVVVAEPCVTFTRHVMRYPPALRSDDAVKEALRSLRAGVRGYYAAHVGGPIVVRVGAAVFLTVPPQG